MATCGSLPLQVADSTKELVLEKTDPVERLEELSDRFYGSNIFYHSVRFPNGIFCKVSFIGPDVDGREPYLQMGILVAETRFVETDDLMVAKRVVAAIALNRLGLYQIEEDPEDDLTGAAEQLVDESAKILDAAFDIVSRGENRTIANIIEKFARKLEPVPID
jgi:hypothetical protein